MALNANVASTWKELTAHGRADAWKDIVEGFQNVEGVWTVIYSSGALIGFSDYPYPIPVMAGWQYRVGDTGDWVKVTEDGEINTSGTFTGVVKASKTLSLNEWYSEEIVEYGDTVRVDGIPLSVGRYNLTSFVNGDKGYVCGGQTGDSLATVDVYDSSGNRTTGTSLSVARHNPSSFVNGNKGYVCGGYKSADDTNVDIVDVYDSSGNRTTGINLSLARAHSQTFVIGDQGFVCGGYQNGGYSSKVDVYDIFGNRTTATRLIRGVNEHTAFANGDKGYVCGGQSVSNSYEKIVNVYDSSGNCTTGTDLSPAMRYLKSFVNGERGYVVPGRSETKYASMINVYDISGNRTTHSSLKRTGHTAFTCVNKGYVCGGRDPDLDTNSGVTDVVYIFDISGNRTTGIPLSEARSELTSFANGERGYVCGGGYLETVDIYYDEEIPTYETDLPITAGSTYTLNGTSGVAETSEILHFDDKVTGTIKYKDGDLYPSLDITVYDEDGTVATGADVVIEDLTCIVTLILRDEDGTILTGIDMNIEKVE